MLKRIRYVSRRVSEMPMSAIEALVEQSSRANDAVGITGALVVAGDVFFQIVEGPTAAIDALYARIRSDRRHTDVVCFDVQEGREMRLFPGWGMRLVGKSEVAAGVRMREIVEQLSVASEEHRAPMIDELARLMTRALRAA